MTVIDAAALVSGEPTEQTRACDALLKACLSIGYFSITNTGVGSETIGDVFSQAKRLFALPDDDPRKQAIKAEITQGGKGWNAMFREPAYTDGTVAHMESFDCGPPRRDLAGLRLPAPLRPGPSVWPDLPGFRASVRGYWDSMQTTGEHLYAGFACALGLDENFFRTRCTAGAPSTLRLVHYPRNDAPDDKVHVGISEHADFEVFTVIRQSAPGLELRDINGNWSPAPVVENQFVVMLGDMLERWTNGYLKATRHRVSNTPWSRHSAVMFFAANADCLVEPQPPFVSANNPPRYMPTTQHEHHSRQIAAAIANSKVPS